MVAKTSVLLAAVAMSSFASNSERSFHACAARGDLQRLKLHLRARAGRVPCAGVDEKDAFTLWTPLLFAAAAGKTSASKLLLEHGAEPTVRDYSTGWTPLHLACKSGRVHTVELLLDCLERDEALLRDGEGRTALELACSSGRAKTVELLLSKLGDAEVEATLGSPERWGGGAYDEEVERCLLRHHKAHKDAALLAEMQAFREAAFSK